MNLLIIVLVLLGVIVVAAWLLYYAISNNVKSVSKEFLGTEDVVQALKDIEEDANNTPLSVSGGNSIYLPRVLKDFPDYHKETMEEKVKEFMFLYLRSLELRENSVSSNIKVTSSVNEEINSKIADIVTKESNEIYDAIKIHAISVVGYTKTKELATVKYQISLEYRGKQKKVQTKYEVSVSYLFQDLDKDSFSLRCNHCGGPIEETTTHCNYCGTLVVRNIIKVWLISNFKKLI